MSTWKALPFIAACLVFQPQATACLAAAPGPAQSATPTTVPLYRVTVVQRSAKAINYRSLKTSTRIGLLGTVLVSDASGSATVRNEDGVIRIAATVRNLPPASSFGGEFLTYVLWGISPEGRASNLGEVVVKNGKGSVKVSEQLRTFGLVVTAEPYFAVSQPSDVVVLENVMGKDHSTQFEFIDAKYELLKRDQYTMNLAPLEPTAKDAKTPLDVYQARNALRIARAAGASYYAPEALGKAQTFLGQAEDTQSGRQVRITAARETVQRAEDARLIAVEKQDKAQEAMERKVAEIKLDASKRETAAAEVTAETALKLSKRTEKENDALRSSNTVLANRNEGLQARNDGLRSQLMEQLNAVLETRATARGLIVNMSGVLFQSGQATLMPIAREKLSKIAGILSTHPGLKIEAEGFTDNQGNDGANQVLSELRAKNTKDYLVEQGVAAASISFKGFGVANPIATNGTAAGRQENRRVELVVSGEGLTAPKAAGL